MKYTDTQDRKQQELDPTSKFLKPELPCSWQNTVRMLREF